MTHVLSRDLREEVAGVQSRELELAHKKSDLEKQLELAEAETLTVKNELKVALRRIDDLQAAIGGEMDSDFVSDQVQSKPQKSFHKLDSHYGHWLVLLSFDLDVLTTVFNVLFICLWN